MIEKLKKILKNTSFYRNVVNKRNKKKRLEICRELSANSKTDEKLVVFSVFAGRKYACSPKAVYEYMIKSEQFKDYKFVWGFLKPDEKREMFNDSRTSVVKYYSKDYYEALAKAKYWILNFKTSEFYIKRDDQIFVECWHGTPLKRLGLDIEVNGSKSMGLDEMHKTYLDDSAKYDYFVSPSEYATKCFVSSFGLDRLGKENIIIEQGYPRNDALINTTEKEISEIRKRLGVPENKKVLLYCPTFRDNQYKKGTGHVYELGLDIKKLLEKTRDEYFLILRVHYLVSNSMDISGMKDSVLDLSDYDDINDLYLISDVLVTDYSSVFFDYANLKRPMLFYMYDLDDYKNNLRDFYIGLDELPGPVYEKEDDLFAGLNNIDCIEEEYREKLEEFSAKYNYLDDGKATERTVNAFICKDEK